MKNEPRFLSQMLGIRSPWEITRHHLDTNRNQLDLWVGLETSRGWFGWGRRPQRETEEHVWRHTNAFGHACFVHVLLPRDTQPANLPWQGEAGMPFTRAMARRIFDLLGEGLPPGAVCKLWNMELNDLWRYKYAVDQGHIKTSAPPTTTPPSAPSAQADDTVPPPDSPVWQRLLQGSLDIELRALNLKLLLTRMRNQLNTADNPDMLAVKQQELQRFFVRNQRALSHELAQLKTASADET